MRGAAPILCPQRNDEVSRPAGARAFRTGAQAADQLDVGALEHAVCDQHCLFAEGDAVDEVGGASVLAVDRDPEPGDEP